MGPKQDPRDDRQFEQRDEREPEHRYSGLMFASFTTPPHLA